MFLDSKVLRRTTLLVLVLCLSGTCSGGESGGTDHSFQMSEHTGIDIWDELRALRDMVVEQRVELRNTKKELRDKVGSLELEDAGSKSTSLIQF